MLRYSKLCLLLQLCLIVLLVWRCQVIVCDGLLAHHRLSRLGKILRNQTRGEFIHKGCAVRRSPYLALECERRPSSLIFERIFSPTIPKKKKGVRVKQISAKSRLVHILHARMIERMGYKALYANDSNGAFLCNLARKTQCLLYDIIAGPTNDPRDQA